MLIFPAGSGACQRIDQKVINFGLNENGSCAQGIQNLRFGQSVKTKFIGISATYVFRPLDSFTVGSENANYRLPGIHSAAEQRVSHVWLASSDAQHGLPACKALH